MWLTVSYISVGLGVLFLVITIILCVKWDIVNIYDTITGRKAKRQIKKYKERDEGVGLATDSLTSGLSATGHFTTESLLQQSNQNGVKVYNSESLIKSPSSERLERIINAKGLTATGEFKPQNDEILRTEILMEDSLEDDIQRTEILDLDEENQVEQGEILDNFSYQPSSVGLVENKENVQENSLIGSDVTQILVEDEEEIVSPVVETVSIQSGVKVSADLDKTQLLDESTQILDEGTQILDEGTAILSEEDYNTSQLTQEVVSSNRIIIKQRGSSYSKPKQAS